MSSSALLSTIAVVVIAIAIYLVSHFIQLPIFTLLGLPPRVIQVVSILLVLVMLQTAIFPPSIMSPIFCYVTLGYLVTDTIGWLVHLAAAGKPAEQLWQMLYAKGVLVWVITAIICLYGYINAHTIVVTKYNINITKAFATSKPLHLLFISDVHLGTAIKTKHLQKLKDKILKLQPDIIILGGDIYDERSREQDINDSYPTLQQLAELCPIYYIPGNHDYGRYGPTELNFAQIVTELEKIGVIPLLDKTVLLPQQIYLVGRHDISGKRLPLETLLQEVDTSKPIIIADHQPAGFAESSQFNVDLQVSGHTHAGQIFPFNFLTGKFNGNINYGYKRNQNSQLIVSSGLGVWGFPIRTARHAEIVSIQLSSLIE